MPKRVHRSAESFTYILAADRALPLDQQSRFRFRPLTQAEKLAVLDDLNWVQINADGSRELRPRSMSQARQLVLSNLEAAENFPTDGPVAWPAEGTREQKERYLDMLDEMDVYELGNEVRHHAQPALPTTTPTGEVTAGNS